MTIGLAWWLRYSFWGRKVSRSNLSSLVTLVVQKKPQQSWRDLSTAKATKTSDTTQLNHHAENATNQTITHDDATHKAVVHDDATYKAVKHE
ncbi:hypothetical protein TNCV_1541771 [Trichonephila clavipes]|nr:hypothetical protein TNCV_1541771 [Trichonephila clavipes]